MSVGLFGKPLPNELLVYGGARPGSVAGNRKIFAIMVNGLIGRFIGRSVSTKRLGAQEAFGEAIRLGVSLSMGRRPVGIRGRSGGLGDQEFLESRAFLNPTAGDISCRAVRAPSLTGLIRLQADPMDSRGGGAPRGID